MDAMLACDWSGLLEVPNILFAGMAAVGIVAIVFGTISAAFTKVVVSRDRERSRRELAAYVAEGTLDADKAVALMDAGNSETDSA
ncbi:MAG: hypothetical protein HKO59_03355 [Phycisphaerales bacterium]|nr:hypothetical protein [Phycisphaerae bacterium]NNF41461.1 hypothetical protein [Phycisphaerales bacterium]NNM25019.1 hypothetical protein [Phycisphaerales bacterium]